MSLFRRCLPLQVLFLTVSSAPATDLVSHAVNGATVDLHRDDGVRFRVSFLAADVIRIQATAGEEFTDEGSGKAPIVLAIEPVGVSLTVREESDQLAFATPAVEFVIRRSPLLLELRRVGDGSILWQELKPLVVGQGGTTQTLASTPDERIFGGGQQNGAYEFKGRLMEISYSGGWEEGDRPSPAPFYMSDRGYGVLRNTWADGAYDFRSDRYHTTTHTENRFDAYVMAGTTYREVLDLYTQFTGRARLLPRWALGYGDADCYNDGDNVDKPGTVPEGWSDGPTGTTPDVIASVATKYREHDMPGSWILPNDGYGCGYEDLPRVVEGLRELGFRTGLWTENGVEKIAREVGAAGTRVQKLDVAWTGKGYQWALDANHDAAQGFLDNSDARPFIWTVMGWAGIQRYAVTWTGDQSGSWDYIRWHVPTLVGSGLSGMNYSTGDVDGIFGGSPETFTRDLQWKCFTPVLMGMSGWSRAERKHPWWFDEPYRSVNRSYLKLRQRLMPYIYTLARETETTGAPMVRGLAWDHSGDPEAYDHPYQFCLGRDLLIAPVYRSQAASGGWREGVHLPGGRWTDYWTGAVIEAGPGGRTVDVPVDLGTLPVFVRAGAIIPMYPESLYDGEVAADPLTLDIHPGGDAEFVLYEDDGDTRAYRDGAFSTQRLAMTARTDDLEVVVGAAVGDFAGKLAARDVELLVHTPVKPREITMGDTLPALSDGAAFASADRGWYHDPADRGGVLRVKAGRLSSSVEHRVRLDFGRDYLPVPATDLPARPGGDGTVGADALMVVSRPAEEPGYARENAFDGDPDTWFRTLRDQRVAYGPHEFVLSLGERRVVEGFRIRPRNDKWWQYGQVKHWEVHLADVNGRWGEPVATGVLEKSEEMQEVRFLPRAGRLLRFRVLGTHDDGVDPMVLGADGPADDQAYDAVVPVRVGPTTISEFGVLERARPARAAQAARLAEVAGGGGTVVTLNGLEFTGALSRRGDGWHEFALTGDWHTFRAEAGLGNAALPGDTARFQVWTGSDLLWDSGPVTGATVVKPRLDVRGAGTLSLRTETSRPDLVTHWAELVLDGFVGDKIKPAAPGREH